MTYIRGERTTILEMIEIIGQISQKTPKIKLLPIAQGDMLHTSASIEKAEKMLTWKPRTNLHSGLSQLVAFHQKKNPLDLD